MTDLQMLGNSFGEFGLESTYVPKIFDQKVHLFENSLLKPSCTVLKNIKSSVAEITRVLYKWFPSVAGLPNLYN